MSSELPKKESKSEEKSKKEDKTSKTEAKGQTKKEAAIGTSKSVEKKKETEEKKKETEEKKKIKEEPAEGPDPATHPVDPRIASRPESWQDEIYQRRSTRKESLRIPREKVNDPTLSEDDDDDDDDEETSEGRKSIQESRSRRPTTPIPVEKKSISQEGKKQVLMAQEYTPASGPTAWTIAGGRASLALPSPFPADQSPERESIATSRARRPTTPIPRAKSSTNPPTPASEEEQEKGGNSSQTSPSIENNPSKFGNTPTIINRVSVVSTPFPGSFFENTLLFPQITVTSPEGTTTTPTLHLQTMTFERGETFNPIRRALSRSIQRSEPNIRH